MRRGEGGKTCIKSNNPNLKGGEKMFITELIDYLWEHFKLLFQAI